ncbi:sporulation protein YqfD [Anaeromassilibacillus senegalensis]|uniref:sporulation protein YqfD n=1 Tax=Anaeromassilibacillus senegalensis TaxID=1673717 RepID=UPI0006802E6A|nr:sporulation protein YqfD [Anaeromassilibacillus senegalensis]
MYILRVLRWIMGYVRFSISGSPERFLNQCARSGVSLWDIRKADGFSACIAAGGYRDLLSCAFKSKTVLRVQERHGLPFRAAFLRKRRGLVAGAVLALVLMQFFSLHFWSIDVVGNAAIPTEQIEASIYEMGLKPGVWKKDVDPQLLQQQIMAAFPQISWLSVNTAGCTVTVQLQERVAKPDIDARNQVCNVTAKTTGQIIYMDVYSGTPEVKEGDAVVEGQLLINAVVEDTNGGSTLKHAAGKIVAATTRSFAAETPMTKEVAEPTGHVVVRRSATLFGIRLPLSFTGKPDGVYRLDTEQVKIRLMNALLPVSLYTETWTEENRRTVPVTQEEALSNARQDVARQQKEQMGEAKITAEREQFRVQDGKLLYTVEVDCEEEIGVETELFLES